MYPDFNRFLKSYQKDNPITVVGDFTAREIVITGADFQISNSSKVKAEYALITWYDVEGEKDNPVVVEFSFKYKNKQEEYDREVSQKVTISLVNYNRMI